jgi:hypothetical protein
MQNRLIFMYKSVTYRLVFSFYFYAKIRFGEHRQTISNRIWHILCTIFGGWTVCHIHPDMSRVRQIWTEYVTCVPYSVFDIYGPTGLCNRCKFALIISVVCCDSDWNIRTEGTRLLGVYEACLVAANGRVPEGLIYRSEPQTYARYIIAYSTKFRYILNSYSIKQY